MKTKLRRNFVRNVNKVDYETSRWDYETEALPPTKRTFVLRKRNFVGTAYNN